MLQLIPKSRKKSGADRRIRTSGTIYIAAYMPRPKRCAEALLSIPNFGLALKNAGDWMLPIAEARGDASVFGNLVAFAFTESHSTALERIDAITTWLDLHASSVTFNEIRFDVSEISDDGKEVPAATVTWLRPDGVVDRPNVFHLRARCA